MKQLEPTDYEEIIGLDYRDFHTLHSELSFQLTTNTASSYQPHIKAAEGRPRKLNSHEHLFLFLMWMKHYPTYQFLSWITNLAVSTVETYIMSTFDLLFQWCKLKDEVKIPTCEELNKAGKILCGNYLVVGVVDGTEQRVLKSTLKLIEQGFFSGKKRLHTFTTLILCSPQGQIYYISPSYPGSCNDKQLFDMTENKAVFSKFEPDQWIIGDLGFKGAYQNCSFWTPIEPTVQPLTQIEQQLNKEFKSMRIVVENVIAAIKVKWNICSDLFRTRDPDFHHKAWYIASTFHNLYAIPPRQQ